MDSLEPLGMDVLRNNLGKKSSPNLRFVMPQMNSKYTPQIPMGIFEYFELFCVDGNRIVSSQCRSLLYNKHLTILSNIINYIRFNIFNSSSQ